ncbi:MAG: hypothetical protein WD750_06565 [Gammaproteobacteria bacterium]
MPDDNENANLARRIEELEALLAEQRVETQGGEAPVYRAANIPILDDVVSPEDYPDTETIQPQPASDEKIAELAQRLEQKFSTELDETVHILKNNLRQSILRELNQQMQADAAASNNRDETSGRFSED